MLNEEGYVSFTKAKVILLIEIAFLKMCFKGRASRSVKSLLTFLNELYEWIGYKSYICNLVPQDSWSVQELLLSLGGLG